MATQQVTLKVSRNDPSTDEEAQYDSFVLPAHRGMTVQDALFYVLENLDDSLAFRYSCRGAVCGACAMVINGQPRLACQTQVLALGEVITLDPLPHLEVIRDLVVNMRPFWDRLESIKPYLIRKSAYPELEVLQTPEQLARIEELSICVQCGICDVNAEELWVDHTHLGPGALINAGKFILDSRDEATAERLALLVDDQGIWRDNVVHDVRNGCPKSVDIAAAIRAIHDVAIKMRGAPQ